MIGPDEIVRGFRGSWRLLLGDVRGMSWFDTSIDGFWRSFFVMVLMLPLPLIELAAQRQLPMASRVDPAVLSGPAYIVVGILSYALAWIAFPLVLALLAKPLGIGPRYVPYMVARNWTTLIGALPSLVVTLAFLLGLMPVTALGPANLAALGFNLYYSWLVARLACAAAPGLAGGLVALDFLLTLVIYTAADRLIGL